MTIEETLDFEEGFLEIKVKPVRVLSEGELKTGNTPEDCRYSGRCVFSNYGETCRDDQCSPSDCKYIKKELKTH